MRIGIDGNNGLVYEGPHHMWGWGLWPTPALSPATIVFPSEGPLTPPSGNEPKNGEFYFREDSFDPVSGIRRGRFYLNDGNQPAQWHVPPHPAASQQRELADASHGIIDKRLYTYSGHPIWHKYFDGQKEQPLVILGFGDRFTIWSIVNVEAISTNEDLVTLSARSGIGVLPELLTNKIPKAYRKRVLESLKGFADEVHRSSPISVIDRARDAASQSLIAHFKLTAKNVKDLGPLAKDLESREMTIASSAAKIIARLHARAKPVEKTRRKMRPVREQDAQLAVQCVGVILCELGWADWR